MQLTHCNENGIVVGEKNKIQYISCLLGNLINPEPADEEIIWNCFSVISAMFHFYSNPLSFV